MVKIHKVFWLSFVLSNQAIGQVESDSKFSYGPLFEIIEPDILNYIHEKISRTEEDGSLARRIKEAKLIAQDYLHNPTPVKGLKKAKNSAITYFDPSIITTQAVVDVNGNTLHPNGTKVNPLETFKLDGKLILFNAKDKNQVKVVKKLVSEAKNTRAILVNGSPVEFFKKTKIRPYFDQKGIIAKRFNIKEIPTVISQEGLHIKLETIAVLQ